MLRFVAISLLAGCAGLAWAQPAAVQDSDRDGISDTLESMLLERFRPTIMVGASDCSVLPAEFLPNTTTPYVLADNGTLYGQATPYKGAVAMPDDPGEREIELHFYILWRTDCGRMGHSLDAEHVSALVRGQGEDPDHWRALYWYAAAHEDTVCDASQLTRASTIHAETHGARVWASNGKHGSFLHEELCTHGCGGDRCEQMRVIPVMRVINVGEVASPGNGAVWIASTRWPLLDKMQRTDFTASRLVRLEGLPETDIAWAEPSKRPAQAAIRGGNAGVDGVLAGGQSTSEALSLSNRNTDTALALANAKTSRALGVAAQNTGSALTKSYRNVRGAVGSAVKHTGEAMGVDDHQP